MTLRSTASASKRTSISADLASPYDEDPRLAASVATTLVIQAFGVSL